jgi:CHAT domain-containing protein
MGIEAEEKAVKHVKNVRILHLATHGFFLEPAKGQDHFQEKNIENPLLRSGIALAGANQAYRIENEEDGILTAYEVTGMDLSNTELVVLSACETGIGSVRSGEGVFGLRRAFSLAGAKNMLLSLWPVSDDITADQMIRFYQAYKNGTPPLTALREAQLDTIKNLRINRKNAPPALWAPFILQVARAEFD